MAKKQSRRNISIRGTTYDCLRKYCAEVEVSMSDFAEQAIADRFVALGKPAPPPSTYTGPKPSPRPLRTEDERDAEVAGRRIDEIRSDPKKLISGEELERRLGELAPSPTSRPPTRKPKSAALSVKRHKESRKAGDPSDDELAEVEAAGDDHDLGAGGQRPRTPLRFRRIVSEKQRQANAHTKPPQPGTDDPTRSGRGASKPTTAKVSKQHTDQPRNVRIF